jgi:hypothetical protein
MDNSNSLAATNGTEPAMKSASQIIDGIKATRSRKAKTTAVVPVPEPKQVAQVDDSDKIKKLRKSSAMVQVTPNPWPLKEADLAAAAAAGVPAPEAAPTPVKEPESAPAPKAKGKVVNLNGEELDSDDVDDGKPEFHPADASDVCYIPSALKRIGSEEWHKFLVYEVITSGRGENKISEKVLATKHFENLNLILLNDKLFERMRFNSFSKNIEILGRVPWRCQEFADEFQAELMTADYTGIRRALYRRYGATFSEDNLKSALAGLTISHKRIDTLYDYMVNLRGKWDGVRRIHRFFADHYGVQQTKVVAAMSERFFIAGAARGVKGRKELTKVDTFVVLASQGQGKKKSSGIPALCPDPAWHGERPPKISSTNDLVMCTQGKLLIEDPEMELINMDQRSKGAIKGWLSLRSDEIVLKYANTPERFPRRFAPIIATTNNLLCLPPDGENRRAWPFEVTKSADPKRIEAVRDQLWAEAVYLLDKGKPWWFDADSDDPEEVKLAGYHKAHVARFVHRSALHGRVYEALLKVKVWTCAEEICDLVFGESTKNVSIAEIEKREESVRDCIVELGWIKDRSTSSGRHRYTGQFNKDKKFGQQYMYLPPDGFHDALTPEEIEEEKEAEMLRKGEHLTSPVQVD